MNKINPEISKEKKNSFIEKDRTARRPLHRVSHVRIDRTAGMSLHVSNCKEGPNTLEKVIGFP